MIRLINEFCNMGKIIMNESIEFGDEGKEHVLSGVYDKAKEIAVNLNDEISKLDIQDDTVYTGVIHKCILTDGIQSIDINKPLGFNDEVNETKEISMPGSELRKVLYRYPGAILSLINVCIEYFKDHIETTEKIIYLQKVIEFLSKSAMELIALVKMKSVALNESYENVDSYISNLNKCIDDIREYYEKSDYAKLLTPRKKKIDKMEEYLKGALDRKYTLRVPLYKIENAKKETRDIIENKFIKDIQDIVVKYKDFVILSPNWDEDEDIYIYLTLKEPFGKKNDSKDRSFDSADDKLNKMDDYQVDTNANKKKPLDEATEFIIIGSRKGDDGIIDICKTLTDKGYTTVASCEGHVENATYKIYGNNLLLDLGAYIKFDKHYDFPSKPKSWDFESGTTLSVSFPAPSYIPKSYFNTYGRRSVYIRKASKEEMDSVADMSVKKSIETLSDHDDIAKKFEMYKKTYLNDLKTWADSLPDTMNEAASVLSKKDRDNLPDEDFGIPSLRKYPLNDEKHIRQAVKMFHYCKPAYKQELANNISKKVKENNLVGKVWITPKNPFKKYFPSWMIYDGTDKTSENKTSKNNKNTQNESVVFINGKLI